MKPELINERLKEIEKEIELVKILVLFKSDYLVKPKPVSFRGMAKLLVSEKELEKSIEEAKISLFKSGL